MHGVVASMALAMAKRIIGIGGGRQVIRQGRALGRLPTALADAFDCGAANFDVGIITALVDLMAAADRAEKRGLRHDSLVGMPAKWAFKRLSIDPPRLALCGAMRLRTVLEERLIAGEAEGRRAVQLRVVKNLAHRLDRDEIAAADALRSVVAAFAVAATAIDGADIGELLGATRSW
jgi:hypothetical protein